MVAKAAFVQTALTGVFVALLVPLALKMIDSVFVRMAAVKTARALRKKRRAATRALAEVVESRRDAAWAGLSWWGSRK